MAEPYAQQSVVLTIANGASASNTIPLHGYALTGLYIPANWTAACTYVIFQASVDGATWYPIYDVGGNLVKVKLAASPATTFVTLVGNDFASCKLIRVVSHNGTTAENQTADISTYAVVRPYLN